MNTEFDCPQCGQRLAVDSSAAGKQVKCPKCFQEVTAPAAGTAENPIPAIAAQDTIFCTKCGQQNNRSDSTCSRCGLALHGPGQQYVVQDGLSALIPYKNAKALWAYYLGVFALIPCVGIPLGIAAVILGILGLKYANLHPEARGKGHAWAGIILGGLCTIGYTLLVAMATIAAYFG